MSSIARPVPPCEHLFLTGNPGVGKTTIVVETAKAVLLEASSAAVQEREGVVDLRVRGFYTEERRGGDSRDRIGFDIVHLPLSGVRPKSLGKEATLDSIVQRAPLARIGKKRSGPMVGKYVVDTDGVERVAVPCIDPDADCASEIDDDDGIDLVLLDEVGKMEMLCPAFLPAVRRALDFGGGSSGRSRGGRKRRIVLGTIPTPRYGRTIDAVEEIRARPDVTVVYITKANRDELREGVKRAVLTTLGMWGDCGAREAGTMADLLRPFLYSRAIGAPSMNGKPPLGAKSSSREGVSNTKPPSALLGPRLLKRTQHDASSPCGPLVHETVEPSVLVLGETASAQPAEVGMEYSERSMWTVFADMMFGRPLRKESSADFLELRETVLSAGIAIWDVLSDVHGEAMKREVGKRPKKDKNSRNFNHIQEFLQGRSSIQAIAFIGAKARKTFCAHFSTNGDEWVVSDGRSVRLVVLPSSSRSNTRMNLKEKSTAWGEALSDFCLKLKELQRRK